MTSKKKSRGCVRQTTKKYTSRKSPSFPANECCGEKKLGNDGTMWLSKPNRKGVCRWVKVARSSKRSSRRSSKRSSRRSSKRSSRRKETLFTYLNSKRKLMNKNFKVNTNADKLYFYNILGEIVDKFGINTIKNLKTIHPEMYNRFSREIKIFLLPYF